MAGISVVLARWRQGLHRLPSHGGFVLALVIGFVLLAVPYAWKVSQTVTYHADHVGQLEAQSRSAILRWLPQLHELRAGIDIYEKSHYPNPPIMAALLLPLTALPPTLAALTWFAIKAALCLAALLGLFRLLERGRVPVPMPVKVLTVLLCLRPIAGDLLHGNVNLLILALLVLAASLYGRGWDGLSGLTLGLAAACKVTPLLFLPYLAWKRSWRAIGGCVAGLVLFLGPVPGLVFGQAENARYLASWYREMVHPFLIEGQVTPEHQNQSIPGVVYRLTTHSPSFAAWVYDSKTKVNSYLPIRYDHFVDLGPIGASLLVKALMFAFACVVVWVCRTPIEPATNRDPWRIVCEWGLIAVGMLLFSERTWKHHAVTLMLPLAALCYGVFCIELPRFARYAVIGLLGSAGFITLIAGEFLLGKAGADTAMVYGIYTVSFLMIGAAVAVVLKSVEPPEPPDELPRNRPTRKLIAGRYRLTDRLTTETVKP